MQQPAMTKTIGTGITPMVTGSPYSRYHVTRADFREICDGDKASADALRGFEQATNQRIEYLHSRYGIEDSLIPADDDLWVEMPLRRLEAITCNAYDKDTYARCLANEVKARNTKKSEKEERPEEEQTEKTLIQRGFIKRRFIARIFSAKKLPGTTVYFDEKSAFIIVDQNGGYIDNCEEQRSAIEEGITNKRGIIQQYLYCFEEINTALAAIAWRQPPKPAARSAPITQVIQSSKKGGATGDNDQEARRSTEEETSIPTARGGYSLTVDVDESSEKQDNTGPVLMSSTPSSRFRHARIDLDTPCMILDAPQRNLDAPRRILDDKKEDKEEDKSLNKKKEESASLFASVKPQFDLEKLRTAEWTVSTLIGLVSNVLPVPDPSQINEETWRTEWEAPAERLLRSLSALPPAQAWQRIDIISRYMTTPGSPSWWVAKRARQSPITLRHVADNQTAQWSDLTRHHWQPSGTTPYDGSLQQYEQGYQGPEQPATAPTEATATKTQRRHYGMTSDTLDRLVSVIEQNYTLSLGVETLPHDRYVLGIEYAPDQWCVLGCLADWYNPKPETKAFIDQAIAYAVSLIEQAAHTAINEQSNAMPVLATQ